MARIVLATHAGKSHVNPLIPVVRELTGRGHEIFWYTARKYRPAIEAAGAVFTPPREGSFVDFEGLEQEHPETAQLPAVARQAWFLEHVWARRCEGQYRDLAAIFAETGAELLVADSGLWAANLLHETHATLWATVSLVSMSLPDPALPPYGKGWHPRPPGSRRRDDLAGRNSFRDTFGPATRVLGELRERLGLPPARGQRPTPYLFMQAATPSFELPRPNLPAHAHFIGPLLPEPPAAAAPAWLAELDDGHPVVLVTQGTMANSADRLIEPAIRALGGGKAHVVVTTGNERARIAIDPLPDNVRVESFVPYHHLLPKVDAIVHNGGFGTAVQGLAHGIPQVTAGRTEDKAETGARLSWCGAGIDLRTQYPEPARIAAAVDAVLDEPWFRAAAARIATEFARHDAVRTAADLLERLLVERGPITRD